MAHDGSIAATVIGNRPVIAQTPGEARRYSFYSPELQLLAETNVTAGTPTSSHEYIWFAGEPIAQVDVATQEIKWTTNDHLGTPLLQTNAAGQVVWRAEREPHGKVWSIRAGLDQHQPLGLPGQEEEQFGADCYPDPTGCTTSSDGIDQSGGGTPRRIRLDLTVE